MVSIRLKGKKISPHEILFLTSNAMGVCMSRYGEAGILCTLRRSVLVSLLQQTLIGAVPVVAKGFKHIVPGPTLHVEFHDGTSAEVWKLTPTALPYLLFPPPPPVYICPITFSSLTTLTQSSLSYSPSNDRMMPGRDSHRRRWLTLIRASDAVS